MMKLGKYYEKSMMTTCITCQKEEKKCTWVVYVMSSVFPPFQFCCNLRNFWPNPNSQIFKIDNKNGVLQL